jgi:hypothetical protein
MRRELEVAPAGISGEAGLQQRLRLLTEVGAQLGLGNTDDRHGAAAVSLLAHDPDSTVPGSNKRRIGWPVTSAMRAAIPNG